MKKLLLIFTLLFSTVMFSSPSYAEWTKITEGNIGSNEIVYFMDFENIKKQGGKVFFWSLASGSKHDHFGNMSNKHYFKVNCSNMAAVMLTGYYYTKPMGKGRHESKTYPHKWEYPPPNTPINTMMKLACRFSR